MISKTDRARAAYIYDSVNGGASRPYNVYKVNACEAVTHTHNISYPLSAAIRYEYVETLTQEGRWGIWETFMTMMIINALPDDSPILDKPFKEVAQWAMKESRARIDAMMDNGELSIINGMYAAPKD